MTASYCGDYREKPFAIPVTQQTRSVDQKNRPDFNLKSKSSQLFPPFQSDFDQVSTFKIEITPK